MNETMENDSFVLTLVCKDCTGQVTTFKREGKHCHWQDITENVIPMLQAVGFYVDEATVLDEGLSRAY